MNTYQLEDAVRADREANRHFLGAFAADILPDTIRKPACLIANTDILENPGKHWVAFYFPEKGIPEFFDSSGHDPGFFGFDSWLKRQCKEYIYNRKMLQGRNSDVCGAYVLYYLFRRSRGVPMNVIAEDFGKDLDTNDIKIAKFFRLD